MRNNRSEYIYHVLIHEFYKHIDDKVVFIKEPGMEKRFGGDYTEYKKKVPMFIPRS